MQINKHTYGHGEIRNKKLKQRKRHYTRMAVLQSLINRLGKERGLKKEKKKLLQQGVFVFGHPAKY